MEKVFLAIGAVIVALVVFTGVDALTGSAGPVSDGTVITRSYTPSTSQTATTYTSDGKTAYTTVSESEKWLVIVRTQDNAVSIQTTSQKWAVSEPGKAVTIRPYLGGISKAIYWWEIAS